MVTNTRPQAYQPRLTDDQWTEAKDRYLKGESAASIAEDFECKRHLLDTRFSRAGLPKVREAMLKQGRGERTKGKFAEISENIADVLLEKTPKSLEDLNLHADTAQKAAKTAALVHGWGEGSSLAIIVAGQITGRPEMEAIEVESTSEVATDGQQNEQE